MLTRTFIDINNNTDIAKRGKKKKNYYLTLNSMVPFLLNIKPFIPAYNTSPSRSSSHLSHAQFSTSSYTQDESHIMQPVM